MPKAALITEEPDLEALFADAVAEISAQVDDSDFDADYGFQSEWDEDEESGEELELKATKLLFELNIRIPRPGGKYRAILPTLVLEGWIRLRRYACP